MIRRGKIVGLGLVVLLAWGSARAGRGQQQVVGESSSLGVNELVDAPEPVFGMGARRGGVKTEYQTNLRRFERWAALVSVGSQGIEVQLGTSLSNKWNLRGGVGYLTGSYGLTISDTSAASNFGADLTGTTIDVVLQPHFQSAAVVADWFPWYGSFRVSPGVTVYNGNRATVVATIEGGQQLSVGSGTYVSDPADPIRATVQTQIGRRFAPRLTVGWGNMIPRRGEHFSFPFEVGVEYIGKPLLALSLAGSECDPDKRCYAITIDPTTAANVLDEQRQLNNDLAPLRFYPIVSSGVSYRF